VQPHRGPRQHYSLPRWAARAGGGFPRVGNLAHAMRLHNAKGVFWLSGTGANAKQTDE